MNTTRWAGVTAAIVSVIVAGAAYALTAPLGRSTAAPAESSTTTFPPVVTSTSSTTTTSTTGAPTTTTTAAPEVEGLVRGAKGEDVAVIQRRLTDLRFDPGPADGVYGLATVYAVQAFQKLHGMEPTGEATPAVEAALAAPQQPDPLMPDGGADRVEIDLPRQLLFLYKGGDLRLISHISSGNNKRFCADGDCRTAITPVGAHRFMWRYPGWRTSSLGKLYKPVYFTGRGVAVHGATSVPAYPASHGCVRIPMHIAEYFPDLVGRGDAVYVLDGKTAVSPATPLAADLGPPPADPPTTPDTEPEPTTTSTASPVSSPTFTPPPTTVPDETSTTSTDDQQLIVPRNRRTRK
ncbi:MAG TPA: L,D-transpeptidase family protein [Acidimicrobiales bacterium]|nr:L,D-transpeptidase family protein [Acidimicrobiales bacterium]